MIYLVMRQLKEKLKGTLIIPIALAVVLVPFSILVGWNLFTLILFWFFIVPAIAILLPSWPSKNKNHVLESLVGLIVFYAIMVFMIYDHAMTDYFQIMILSCVINLVFVYLIGWTRKKIQTH